MEVGVFLRFIKSRAVSLLLTKAVFFCTWYMKFQSILACHTLTETSQKCPWLIYFNQQMKTHPRATASSSCHSLWWQENTKVPEPRETQDCSTHPHNQPPSAQVSSPAIGSVFLQEAFLYHPGEVCFQIIICFLTSFFLPLSRSLSLLFFVLHQHLFSVRNHSWVRLWHSHFWLPRLTRKNHTLLLKALYSL